MTSDGDHAPSAWAQITADQICDLIRIEGSSSTAVAAQTAKDTLRATLVLTFTTMHGGQQSDEDAAIKTDARRLNAAHDPGGRLGSAMAAVLAATQGTPFATHFAQPAVQAVVRGIIASHLVTIANARRSWAADRLLAADPKHKQATRYRAQRSGGA